MRRATLPYKACEACGTLFGCAYGESAALFLARRFCSRRCSCRRHRMSRKARAEQLRASVYAQIEAHRGGPDERTHA